MLIFGSRLSKTTCLMLRIAIIVSLATMAGLLLLFSSQSCAATVTLAWDAPLPVEGYIVEHGTQHGGPYPNRVVVPGGSTFRVEITGLGASAPFFFTVKTYAAGGLEGPPTGEGSGTTTPDGGITATWFPPLAATGYKALWGPRKGPYPNSKPGVGGALTMAVDSIPAGVETCFVVRAVADSATGVVESANSNEACATPVVPQPKLLYSVTFGDGKTDPLIGANVKELTSSGGATPIPAPDGSGEFKSVPNPHKDAVNSSYGVGRSKIPAGYKRAELTSFLLPAEGHAYSYKWKMYLPAGFDNVGLSWMSTTQWKTYPCGKSATPDEVCGSGGHLDDALLSNSPKRLHDFRVRANPSCATAHVQVDTGAWVKYRLDVKWTTGMDGYYKLWKNDNLIFSRVGINTLNASFAGCGINWALGLYADTTTGAVMYLDDVQIWEIF